MRHLRSFLYALVLAPAVWILCGVGFTRDLTGRARDAGSVETASAILLLVLAGAAYAILIFSPISPLGPALFGLLFLGVNGWAVIAPDSYAGVWPAGITKEGFDLSRPGYALAALLAIPMLCTALSVRRWREFEPPQLPLIGTWGRARGAAVAPGVPVAAEQTAVITTEDPTEVINLPAPERAEASWGSEKAPGTQNDETVAEVASTGPEDEPTEATTHEVEAGAAEAPPTEAQPTEAEAQSTDGDDVDEPTEANTRETETITADLGVAPAAGLGGATQVIFWGKPADQDAREPGARTQVIDVAGTRGQPIPGDRTQVLPGARRTEPADDRAQKPSDAETSGPAGEQTQVNPAGEQTQATPAGGEQTKATLTGSEQTRATTDAGEQTRATPDGERTQAIRDAGNSTQVILGAEQPAGDHTQKLPRPGMVEPPGDHTQVLSFPLLRPDEPRINLGERTTDKQELATRASSINSSEQPDPAADPTTLLSSLRPAGEGVGEDTTADVGDNRRSKGMLDLERPADETADDPRPLVVPTGRQPSDDEPTTRL